MVLLGIALVMIVPYLPGNFIPDTLDMCHQAGIDRYGDWHSPIFAGMWGFVDPPLELLFVGQVVLYVLAVYLILARWLKPWVAVAATAFVALFPATIGWAVNVGKDEWFAVAFLWGIAFIGRASDAPPGRRRVALMVATFVAFWLAVAARQLAIVPIGAALLVAWPGTGLRRVPNVQWKRWLARSAVVAAWVAVTLSSTVAWAKVVVDPVATFPEQPTYEWDLAALSVRSGELLLPRSVMKGDTTFDDIRRNFTYREGGANSLIFGENAPLLFPISDSETISTLAASWRQAIRDHPAEYLKHRLTYLSYYLNIAAPPPVGSLNDPGSRPETFGLDCPLRERYFPTIFEKVHQGLRWFEDLQITRGWFFVLLLCVSAAIAGLRTSPEARALLVAGLANAGVFAVLSTGPAFRYMWFTVLCALIVTMLALSRFEACRLKRPSARGPRRRTMVVKRG